MNLDTPVFGEEKSCGKGVRKSQKAAQNIGDTKNIRENQTQLATTFQIREKNLLCSRNVFQILSKKVEKLPIAVRQGRLTKNILRVAKNSVDTFEKHVRCVTSYVKQRSSVKSSKKRYIITYLNI